MDLTITVEMDARASSSYTRETIENRLAVLATRADDESLAEVAFLQGLLEQQ